MVNSEVVMALKPCKVCGTLNGEEVDTCLSCGHDPKGSKRPAIFRYVAIALVVCFSISLVPGLVNWILWQSKPKSPQSNPPKVSVASDHILDQ